MEKTSINTRFLISTVVAASMSLASISAFASEPPETQAYVDSITKWGAWELDIEPAAGGLAQADTDALKARDAKVSPRTNSFSAVSPQANLGGGGIDGRPPGGTLNGPTTFAPPGATPPTTVSPPASPNIGPANPPTIPSGNGNLF